MAFTPRKSVFFWPCGTRRRFSFPPDTTRCDFQAIKRDCAELSSPFVWDGVLCSMPDQGGDL